MNSKLQKRIKRKKSIRKRIFGTSEKPRLTVFRSNKHISVQVVNDDLHRTILGMSDEKISKGTKSEKSAELGTSVAKSLKSNKVATIVFDRNGYRYHGRIKALADAMRSEGIQF